MPIHTKGDKAEITQRRTKRDRQDQGFKKKKTDRLNEQIKLCFILFFVKNLAFRN